MGLWREARDFEIIFVCVHKNERNKTTITGHRKESRKSECQNVTNRQSQKGGFRQCPI